jgi:hypothetical protein
VVTDYSVGFTLGDYGITDGLVELLYYAVDLFDIEETVQSQFHNVVLSPP